MSEHIDPHEQARKDHAAELRRELRSLCGKARRRGTAIIIAQQEKYEIERRITRLQKQLLALRPAAPVSSEVC